ncbi:transposase [Streptomyces tanashiensis]|uniref:Insertion element IS402-like domain-containing protein n=1 Tax=Streptomyces tanashiensis TaxID=67367 RepID=A0ABY6R9T7_9ACTN|nr:transposase [Streptomyces tanashiensis]UZX26365.1 hypothetical protein LDH80_00905 [Streptomyces tanashiensis]
MVDGMRWRTRTGTPRREVPERYGPWDRVHDLFRRRRRDGTRKRAFTELQSQVDAKDLITWDVNVDSRICRAHQHAAGAVKWGSCMAGVRRRFQPRRPPGRHRQQQHAHEAHQRGPRVPAHAHDTAVSARPVETNGRAGPGHHLVRPVGTFLPPHPRDPHATGRLARRGGRPFRGGRRPPRPTARSACAPPCSTHGRRQATWQGRPRSVVCDQDVHSRPWWVVPGLGHDEPVEAPRAVRVVGGPLFEDRGSGRGLVQAGWPDKRERRSTAGAA